MKLERMKKSPGKVHGKEQSEEPDDIDGFKGSDYIVGVCIYVIYICDMYGDECLRDFSTRAGKPKSFKIEVPKIEVQEKAKETELLPRLKQ